MLSKNIFTSDYIYERNSIYFAKFLKKLFNDEKINLKKIKVLDFGCGPGTLHKYIKFKYLYTYDKFSINALKSKKNFKSFIKLKKTRNKFDLILINSVAQYIDHKNFSRILNILFQKLQKKGIIFVGEVPKYNRFVELLLMFSPIKILYLFFYFIKRPSYINQSYYLYNKSFFEKLLKKKIYLKFLSSNSFFFDKRFCVIIKKL